MGNTDGIEQPRLMLTDRAIINFLWLMFALTFSLFSVSLLRINTGIIHFAIPEVILCFIFVLEFFSIAVGKKVRTKVFLTSENRFLFVLCYLFLFWHVCLSIKTVYWSLAIKDIVRMVVGLITFWGFVIFFPADRSFFEKFMLVMFWGMSILLVPLIYRCAVTFHLPFLSADWSDPTQRYTKNQLAYFISRVSPFALFYFLYRKRRLVAGIPLLIMLVSVIYSASRGAWISFVAGVVFVAFNMFRKRPFASLKMMRTILVGSAIFLVISIFTLSKFVDLSSEIEFRFISIYDPQLVASKQMGTYSYLVRGARIDQALKGFMTSPFAGVGLANTYVFVDGLVHNDYAAILLQLGIVGIILFLMILLLIWNKMRRFKFSKNTSSWALLGAQASFVALLMVSMVYDNYASAYFWLFLALYVKVVDIEKGVIKN